MSTIKNTVLYEDIIINAKSINLHSYFNINTLGDFTGEDLYYICFEPVLFDRFGQVRYNILKKIGYILKIMQILHNLLPAILYYY